MGPNLCTFPRRSSAAELSIHTIQIDLLLFCLGDEIALVPHLLDQMKLGLKPIHVSFLILEQPDKEVT